MNDIEVLENMRDNIYGAMQFEDDYQVSELEEKEFHALNSAITALKERQADKDRIKELEKENETLIEARNWYFEHFTSQACTPEQLRKILAYEYIPKSLVKEKMEELNKKEQELQNSISDEEREEYSDANISFLLMDIEIRRSVLQELLGESYD